MPAVYVNNVLGRDAAIEDLELAVLCEEEARKEEEVLTSLGSSTSGIAGRESR